MKPELTIFGDYLLDEYQTVERIKENPESTGAVYAIRGREQRAGGAGAVALIGRGLGAACRLIGPIGQDAGAVALCAILEATGASLGLTVEAGRQTPTKTRHLANGKLLPDRFDVEQFQPFHFEEMPRISGTLVISDYGKGACSNVETLIAFAKQSTTCNRIIVDPAPNVDWRRYIGASIIKANYAECRAAVAMLGYSGIGPIAIASKLSEKLHCEIVLTKDREGMYLSNGAHIPAMPATVVDVCGAGDTVTAAIAISLEQRLTLEFACRYAAKAAAKQIESIGVCQVCPQ